MTSVEERIDRVLERREQERLNGNHTVPSRFFSAALVDDILSTSTGPYLRQTAVHKEWRP